MSRLLSLFTKKKSENENNTTDLNKITLKLPTETENVAKLRDSIIEPPSPPVKSILSKSEKTASPTQKNFISKMSNFEFFKKRKSIQLNLNELSKQDETHKKSDENIKTKTVSAGDEIPLFNSTYRKKIPDSRTNSFDREETKPSLTPLNILSTNSIDLSDNLQSAPRRTSRESTQMIKTARLSIPKKEDSPHSVISANHSYDELKKPVIDKIPPQQPAYKTFHEETQYLNLVKEIIQTGSYEKSRNGNTYTKFGYTMRFNLKNGMFPLLTTKRMAWKTCFEELFWFIRGSTSNAELQKKNVHIWDDNCKREFLDKRGLYYYKEGDLGPIYGHQWRHFNAEYKSCNTCYQGEGIDQLQYIIDQLKNPATRTSRRLIMTAWNPCQISSMALPPCHILAQFHVRENKYLSCALFQRSGDVGLGVPFNIASYSLLTHILAKHCGLEADEFVHFLGNCHIYEEHVESLKTQIQRDPLLFPRIEIQTKYENIEDYCLDDIVWTTKYHSHEPIKMTMVP